MSDIGDNSSKRPRGEIIREIKAELDAVRERELNIREVKKSLKGRMKAELGFKVADWAMMTRIVELEEDARTELMTTIREGCAALGVGEQGSFLAALDPTPPASTIAAEAPKSKGKKRGKSKAEQIAEAIAADDRTSERRAIDEQKAHDAAEFDHTESSPSDIDEVVAGAVSGTEGDQVELQDA